MQSVKDPMTIFNLQYSVLHEPKVPYYLKPLLSNQKQKL
jgi:hypothetical protein